MRIRLQLIEDEFGRHPEGEVPPKVRLARRAQALVQREWRAEVTTQLRTFLRAPFEPCGVHAENRRDRPADVARTTLSVVVEALQRRHASAHVVQERRCLCWIKEFIDVRKVGQVRRRISRLEIGERPRDELACAVPACIQALAMASVV